MTSEQPVVSVLVPFLEEEDAMLAMIHSPIDRLLWPVTGPQSCEIVTVLAHVLSGSDSSSYFRHFPGNVVQHTDIHSPGVSFIGEPVSSNQVDSA